MEEATVRHSLEVDPNFRSVKQHIIVCGNVTNLYHFIRTLRRKTIGIPRPIVVLYHNASDADERSLAETWARINHFVDVYVVRGSPLEAGDLRRAGIRFCKKVVILAKSHAGDKSNIEALVDADTIFTHKVVMRELDIAHSLLLEEAGNDPAKVEAAKAKVAGVPDVVTEILLRSNIPYCGYTPPVAKNDNIRRGVSDTNVDRRRASRQFQVMGQNDGSQTHGTGASYYYSEQFASGHVYTSATIDALVCQAYYNESIVDVLEIFVSADSARSMRNEALRVANEGKGVGNTKLLTADEVLPECSHVYNIPVFIDGRRPEFIDTFGKLFKHLTERCAPPIIPLGLYREPSKPGARHDFENALPYVFTCPHGDTPLVPSDRVFVLSPYNEDKQQRHLMQHQETRLEIGGEGAQDLATKAPMERAESSHRITGKHGNMHVAKEIQQLRREMHQLKRIDMAVNTSELVAALRQAGATRQGKTAYD